MRDSAFSVLAHRPFALWYAGQVLFMLGNKAQWIVLSWMIYELSGSLTALGLAAALMQLPLLAVGPLGGWLGDRYDEARLVRYTQAGFMLVTLVLAGLHLAGALTLPLLLAGAAAYGLLAALDAGPRPALMQRVVGERTLVGEAVAMNSLAFNASRFVSPALAGLVLATLDAGRGLLLLGLLGLPLLLLLHLRPVPGGPAERAPTGFLDGFRYAWGHADTRRVLLVMAVTSLLASPYIQLLPAIARELFHGQAQDYAWLFTLSGIGSFAASLAMALRRPRAGLPRLCGLGMALGALAVAGFILAASAQPALAKLLLVLSGSLFLAGGFLGNVYVQTTVPVEYRSRVLALMSAASLGLMPVGTLLTGWAAQRWGLAEVLVGECLLACAMCLALAREGERAAREVGPECRAQ